MARPVFVVLIRDRREKIMDFFVGMWMNEWIAVSVGTIPAELGK